MRKDWQTLELCDRFFDAIEQNDYETLEACYAPEAVIWHSHDCLYQPRADNLAMLENGMKTLPKVRFKDRRVRVFDGGFVQHRSDAAVRRCFNGPASPPPSWPTPRCCSSTSRCVPSRPTNGLASCGCPGSGERSCWPVR